VLETAPPLKKIIAFSGNIRKMAVFIAAGTPREYSTLT
jgi:hypothetical protein